MLIYAQVLTVERRVNFRTAISNIWFHSGCKLKTHIISLFLPARYRIIFLYIRYLSSVLYFSYFLFHKINLNLPTARVKKQVIYPWVLHTMFPRRYRTGTSPRKKCRRCQTWYSGSEGCSLACQSSEAC